MRVFTILSALSALVFAAHAPAQNRQPPAAEEFRAQVPPNVVWTPDIAYREGNDAWKLDLAVPKAKPSGLRPGMVIVHGGGWRSNDKRGGVWGRFPLEFAQRGYVAISVNYRLLPEVTIRECVEDVKNALRWLRAHAAEYQLDPDRIGAYGNSAGAHLVAMLGLAGANAELEGDGPYPDHAARVAAVLASATPTDFPGLAKDRGRSGREPLGGEPDEQRALSPITYVRSDAPPFLLVHGTADPVVPIPQARRFVEAMREAGAEDITLMIFDGAKHGVFQDHRLLTYPAMFAFFDKTLSR